MKLTFLFVVTITGCVFGATPAVSQPSQQPVVIPPELLRLSLQPQSIAPAIKSPTSLSVTSQEIVCIDRRQPTVDPLPPADYRVELLPLARLRGDLIDDRR
jgi:hypothetical protein